MAKTKPIYTMSNTNQLYIPTFDDVKAAHNFIRKAVHAWGMKLCAVSPDLYSDTVSAIYVPEGFDSDALTNHAFDKYNVSFGIGLGEMAGKAFRIGHLGSMTDVMALSGIAAIEMAMKDLDYPVELGSGVSVAQEYYRKTTSIARSQAA